MKNDEVNNPRHYDLFPGQQAIDVIKAALTPEEFRGYCKGNALKYRLRAGEKGPADVDLKKSNWYRERLYEDGSAYFALMGEQASGDRKEPECPVNHVGDVLLPPGFVAYKHGDSMPGPGTVLRTVNKHGFIAQPREIGYFRWAGVVGYQVVEGDWVQHDGSGCPVPEGTRVEVRYREEREAGRRTPFEAGAGAPQL